VGSMFALDFDWDGEFRSRSAAYNNFNGQPSGHTDNRLRLGFNTELHPTLNLRTLFEMSHVWSEGVSPFGGTINVAAKEVYIDFLVEAMKSRVRVGHQPWADHRGLVLDDTFSGVSLTHELSDAMSFKAAFGKYDEGARFSRYDDTQGFIFNFNNEADLSYGADAFLTWARRDAFPNDPYVLKFISLAPYLNMQLDPINLDATVIFQLNDSYDWVKDEVNTDALFGASVNVGMEMDALEWNADLLFLSEDWVNELAGYYQNNLYLLGNGEHHDGLGIYAFGTIEDSYLGLTGQVKFALSDQMKFFGAAGFVNGAGIEVNGGVEYKLIPDLLGVAAYGAYAIMDEDTNAEDPYAIGATLKVEF
ncbi:MAG TPA: hypothetical protein PL126_05800, partial [Candidatus Cloacimonadota bacterium]|nr:hypothetical protein [Candidatus Cloacimonadota bacterium]